MIKKDIQAMINEVYKPFVIDGDLVRLDKSMPLPHHTLSDYSDRLPTCIVTTTGIIYLDSYIYHGYRASSHGEVDGSYI